MGFGVAESGGKSLAELKAEQRSEKAADSKIDHLDERLQPARTPTHQQPTAADVGLDLDSGGKVDLLTRELAAAQTGVAEGTQTIFSSHPIQKFRVGDFQFERGVLKFNGDEPEDLNESAFRDLLEDLPAVDRAAIREISVNAAEQLIADHQLMGGATKQFDSSAGREALAKLTAQSPTVGKQDIAHAAMPMTDQNVPQATLQPLLDAAGEPIVDAAAQE